MFPCKYCKNSMKSCFIEHLWWLFLVSLWKYKSTFVFINISKCTFITIKKLKKTENGCCISLEYTFFSYNLSCYLRVITVHGISTTYFVNYATIKSHSHFCTRRATDICLLWPVIAINRLQQQKTPEEKASFEFSS